MFKKIITILRRDFLSSRRDAMAMYIMIIPLIMAVAITLFSPGLNDTTVNLAMLESDTDRVEFMEQFAKVETFKNVDELEARVLKRDDMVAINPYGDSYEIIFHGNEDSIVREFATMLNVLYDSGASTEESNAAVLSYGFNVPPLKTKLLNMLISLTIMLAGMLISLTIVEEKTENTINALNVTPLSQNGYIIGKSMLGGVVVLISIILSVIITGYGGVVNWFMIILVGITSMLLSLIIGFVQGLNSDDVMEAAAGVKMLMLPIAGSIVGYELLSDKWQWTMYWSPFYWAYRANDSILSQNATWGFVLMCTGIVAGITLIVYMINIPKIRKGLS